MSEVHQSDSESPSHNKEGYVSAVLKSISSTAQVAYEQLPAIPSLTNTATHNTDDDDGRPGSDKPAEQPQTLAQPRQEDMASAHPPTAKGVCKFHFVPHQAPAHSPAASSMSPDQSTQGYHLPTSPTSGTMRSPPSTPLVLVLEPSGPSENFSYKKPPSEDEAALHQPAAHDQHASSTAPDASTVSSTHEAVPDELSDGTKDDFADASETLDTPQEGHLPLTPREPRDTCPDSHTKSELPDPSTLSLQSSVMTGGDQQTNVTNQSDKSSQSHLDEPLSPGTHHHKKGKILNKIVDLKEKVKVKLHK